MTTSNPWFSKTINFPLFVHTFSFVKQCPLKWKQSLLDIYITEFWVLSTCLPDARAYLALRQNKILTNHMPCTYANQHKIYTKFQPLQHSAPFYLCLVIMGLVYYWILYGQTSHIAMYDFKGMRKNKPMMCS